MINTVANWERWLAQVSADRRVPTNAVRFARALAEKDHTGRPWTPESIARELGVRYRRIVDAVCRLIDLRHLDASVVENGAMVLSPLIHVDHQTNEATGPMADGPWGPASVSSKDHNL